MVRLYRHNLMRGVAWSWWVVLLAGCQTPVVHQDYAAFVRAAEVERGAEDYRLGVPDVVVVTRQQGPSVIESMHTLGHDGRLWIDGLGSVLAVDRTTRAVAGELTQRAEAALASKTEGDADELEGSVAVGVRVETFASRKIFVYGQVESPGPQAYRGSNRVLDTVSVASPNPRADLRRALVLRPHPDGTLRRRMTVDLEHMIRDGDTTLNVVLQDGDVIYLRPTARWGRSAWPGPNSLATALRLAKRSRMMTGFGRKIIREPDLLRTNLIPPSR